MGDVYGELGLVVELLCYVFGECVIDVLYDYDWCIEIGG